MFTEAAITSIIEKRLFTIRFSYMNIQQLKALSAVLKTGSLNKAAQELRVSQPALTKAIQRLEAEVGVRLFTRNRSGMRPTPYAEMLRPYAEAVTSGLTETLAKIETSRSGERSFLRVSGAPHTMAVLFPNALVKLKQQLPDLQLRVVTPSSDLVAGLIDGEYDLAVTALDERIGAMKVNRHFLLNDRLVIATRPGHPLTRTKKVTPAVLKGLQWVYSGESTWHRRRLEIFFQEAGITAPPASIECRTSAVQKAIIASSDHVGLVTRLGVRSDVAAGTLRIFEIDSPLMARPIGFLWGQDKGLTAAAKQFIRAVEQTCRSLS
jgi:DNA-binding transcriptional LysR family regulator